MATTAPSSASPHPALASSKRSSTTPFTPVPRTPASVGQLIPPSLRPPESRPPSHHQKEARSPSPSYFGLTVDPAKEYPSSDGPGIHARGNWSPPTSNVRSTAAISPRIIPLDQNTEYDAFRQQTEVNGIGDFPFGRLSAFGMPQSNHRSALKFVGGGSGSLGPPSPRARQHTPTERKFHEPKPRSPKRLLSSPSPQVTDRPRRNSPADFNEEDARNAPQFYLRDADVRSSLPPMLASPRSPPSHQRSETLPAALDSETAGEGTDGPVLVTPQHVVNLLDASNENILLLDLRVASEYGRSRISGALNLCIPSIVLKRPSCNLSKLSDTFDNGTEQKRKFERWRSCQYIIAYDSRSSLLKDASGCLAMLKKFTSEGWQGFQYIIRGGFSDFSRTFPHLVAHNAASGSSPGARHMSIDARSSAVPAVVGGCPMPSSVTKNAANPFFGNIRQNMDLIGGVGQMEIKLPASLTKSQEDDLPLWLRKAADRNDNGKLVSEKFLQIEKREQHRMQDALSMNVQYGTPGAQKPDRVLLAGIEKGAKNRYNNIWPYEHSRVKLQGISEGGCDYINANHIKAEWSQKRYIATQGPIPATFTDFWSVVWQQDVRVIVMLTAEKEAGQIKAHNYWEPKHHGALHLTFLSEHRASIEPSKIHRHRDRPAGRRRSTNPTSGRLPPQNETDVANPSSEQAYVIVRRFTLSHADQPFEPIREITQLQYSNWPDFGAPAHPAHLLGLVEQCDAVVRVSNGGSPPSAASVATGQPRPILVHCSAGCGRTGTFCTVDSVLDMMKRQRARAELARAARHVSPMDIEGVPPPLLHQQLLQQQHLRLRGGGSGGDDGFAADFANPADLEWLCRDDVDLIEKTVEDFRLQRLSMVQSLRQFVLCYESVLEWLATQTPKSA